MKSFVLQRNFREVRLKMEEELDKIYKCLEGEEFEATYKGEFGMGTGKERSVLEIDDSDMETILKKIRKQVKKSDELANKKVWKAITGPEDGYGNYWLWVNLEEDLKEGKSYLFCVTEVEAFSKVKWLKDYNAGVSIEVTKVKKL